MAISTRMDPLDRDIALIIDEELSPAARSAALAVASLEALVDADAINTAALGYRVPHDTFVDGTPGRDADVDRVRPDGGVLFAFQLLGDVIQYVDGLLIGLSPHRSGRYARSHLFFADDVQADPMDPPPARQYAFVNALPYARKIERGLSSMAPDGVYEQAALQARSRFGNITTVRFSYRSLPGGELGDWAAKTSLRSRRGRRRPQQTLDWLTRQPAILIGG